MIDSGFPSDNYITNVLTSFEGDILVSYKDTGGIPTIGYGHTGPNVKLGMTETQEQALADLKSDIAKFNTLSNTLVKVPRTQNQRDGTVDFLYNTGATGSSIWGLINAGNWQAAATFMANHYETDSLGHKLPGLVKRRAFDAADLIS